MLDSTKAKFTNNSNSKTKKSSAINFNHNQEYIVEFTGEFVDYCTDELLSIEVWGIQNVISGNEIVDGEKQNFDTEKTNEKYQLQEIVNKARDHFEALVYYKDERSNNEGSNQNYYRAISELLFCGPRYFVP